MKKIALSLLVILAACQMRVPNQSVYPQIQTTAVNGDADDCAIWIDFNDSTNSTIIGNDQLADGALYVWDLLSGEEIYRTPRIDHPVNPDIRQNVHFGNRTIDIVACGTKNEHRIYLYAVDHATRHLTSLVDGGVETGVDGPFSGFTLYHPRGRDELYCFISVQHPQANIRQYQLIADGDGTLRAKLLRTFGGPDQVSYVEGMVTDDDLGYLYCSDEQGAVLKYYADAEKGDALVDKFAISDGIVGDREGIDLYYENEKEGFLILSSQGNSTVKVYDRVTNRYVTTLFTEGASNTDGLAASSHPIGEKFPKGVLVCHNNRGNNFVVYSWADFNLPAR